MPLLGRAPEQALSDGCNAHSSICTSTFQLRYSKSPREQSWSRLRRSSNLILTTWHGPWSIGRYNGTFHCFHHLAGRIASAYTGDEQAYKLTKHSGFNPETVYNAIYHASCHRLLISSFKERSYSEQEATKQAKDQEQYIERHLAGYYQDMISFGKSAA